MVYDGFRWFMMVCGSFTLFEMVYDCFKIVETLRATSNIFEMS